VDTRPIAVAAEQIERTPSERHGDRTEWAIEKPADIIDKELPARRRHVVGRPLGIEARETLGPCPGKPAAMLNDRRALFLGLSPNSNGAISGRRRRRV
jgi:hypothetical protein